MEVILKMQILNICIGNFWKLGLVWDSVDKNYHRWLLFSLPTMASHPTPRAEPSAVAGFEEVALGLSIACATD